MARTERYEVRADWSASLRCAIADPERYERGRGGMERFPVFPLGKINIFSTSFERSSRQFLPNRSLIFRTNVALAIMKQQIVLNSTQETKGKCWLSGVLQCLEKKTYLMDSLAHNKPNFD